MIWIPDIKQLRKERMNFKKKSDVAQQKMSKIVYDSTQ